jgi:photosystem II stability/assembly factor-like uncharacterized protein
MRLEDRLRRDLPEAVRDVRTPEQGWTGVERGLVRHHRRVIAARAGLTAVVLVAFGGILWWAATSFTGQQPGPRPASPPPSPVPTASSAAPGGEAKGFQPSAAAFFDASHGLSGGDTARDCGAEPCGGAIERTDDGGRTWQVVYRDEAPVTGMTVAGSEAWALVGPCPVTSQPQPCDNRILHSPDGGSTWDTLGRAPVYELRFATPLVGWALSTNAVLGSAGQPVARTLDGGRTWVEVPSPCPGEAPLPSSVDFVDADHGWVACVGDAATIQQGKAVFETTDGGSTWETRAQILTGAQQAGDLNIGGHTPQLFFLPDGHGWLWMSRDCLYKTTDRGQTWTRTGGTDLCERDLDEISSVQFLDDHDGFALVRSPAEGAGSKATMTMLTSHDGGATWSVVQAWPAS